MNPNNPFVLICNDIIYCGGIRASCIPNKLLLPIENVTEVNDLERTALTTGWSEMVNRQKLGFVVIGKAQWAA
jgi:hypothetical protein